MTAPIPAMPSMQMQLDAGFPSLLQQSKCYKSSATKPNPLSDNSRGDFGISSLNFDILYIILSQCDMPWPPLQKSEKEMKEVAQNPTLSLENRHRAENIRRERSLSRVLKSQYLHSHPNNIIK
ncbi:hypothetical protein VNO80_00398 [Phaseolus coccineus]|uniref:Uncharacterized protein n=1 Tax=Phaseolus coccineus TaxID=3886 RepID=A0AAN9NZZ7_PHACN